MKFPRLSSRVEMIEETKKAIEKIPREWLRSGWHGPAAVFNRVDGRRVLFGVEFHDDGKWQHLSLSRPDRNPSWIELREAKNVFMGPEATAIQIAPPESEYVNEHRFCFHLWRYLDGPLWPVELRK